MIKIRTQLLCAVAGLMLTLASCSDDSTTNNNNTTNPSAEGKMDVTIDGTVYSFTAIGVKNGTSYQVTGSDQSGKSVSVSLQSLAATGTFSTSSTSPFVAISYGTGAQTTYAATVGNGSGTVTISQLTPNFKGTFSGTLNRLSGSTGGATASITSGSFNVVIQ